MNSRRQSAAPPQQPTYQRAYTAQEALAELADIFLPGYPPSGLETLLSQETEVRL